MRTRIISGAAVAIIAAALIIAGGNILAGALLVVSCIAYRELTLAMNVSEKGRSDVLAIAGYIGIIIYYIMLTDYNGQIFRTQMGIPLYFLLFILQVGLLMLMLAVYVLTFPRYKSEQVMAAYFCFYYGPVMLSFIYLTERLQRLGTYAVWMIFIASWICDTCAYFSGMALGKHKMAPVLSPKKTIEGAIGGVLGSALAGAVFCYFLVDAESTRSSVGMVFAISCGIGAIISQIGDLAASAIKRNHDIKDYGKCIPGHGGIMDRFDSVIFTAPMIYFLSVILL